MAGKLEGKTAIITGGGRGIGREVALLYAREGARVIVNDLGVSVDGEGKDNSPATQVVTEIKAAGGEAIANFGDVADMDHAEDLVRTALNEWGQLDILVNVAGILRDRMIFNMGEDDWDAVIAVHLKGHFTITRFATMVFRQQRSGRIVNTSSESGMGNMGQANYSAAKEGIIGLTRTLALDLGKYGVTANAIRPRAGTRLTMTPELRAAMEKARATRAAGGAASGGQDPISAMDELRPELVAPLVVYLCTDAAANVNGRDFVVGGNEVSLVSLAEKERSIFREGGWDLPSLARVFPQTLGSGLKNPMPPQAAKPS